MSTELSLADRIKRKGPTTGTILDVELSDGTWAAALLVQPNVNTLTGQIDSVRLIFPDMSVADVPLDDINWRWPK